MEKKEIKIKLKTLIIIIISVILIIALIGTLLYFKFNNDEYSDTADTYTYTKYDYISTDKFNNLSKYDNYITDCIYSSEADRLKQINLQEGIVINSNEDLEKYNELCKDNNYYNFSFMIKNNFDITDEFWNNKSIVTYMYYDSNYSVAELKVRDIYLTNNKLNVEIAVSQGKKTKKSSAISVGESTYIDASGEIVYILTDKIDSNTELEFSIEKYNAKLTSFEQEMFISYKPVIYLYPEIKQEVKVELGNSQRLTHTYPKYENSWNVIASPNGDLVDIKTRRNLYCLYWEGINTVEPNMEEGFVVKGEDTIEFLEEKLEILGLNEREANEFIIYWLPKLESNKYNFIRFQTEEETNQNMPLKITPTPDTIIRVVMEFKALDEKNEVREQKLETPTREGFTVVEWGGTEIK